VGTEEQPFWDPATVMLGCTMTAGSPLNTLTIETDVGVTGNMRFFIDTGAELCLCKYSSIKEGISYGTRKTLNVKGISDSIIKTLGELNIGLCTKGHKMEHPFQIVGDGLDIPYDCILGKDFFERKGAKIDYNHRQVIMGKVRVKFDADVEVDKEVKTVYVTVKPRSGTIVRLPTDSRELKQEY
jgi:hypothetical protein